MIINDGEFKFKLQIVYGYIKNKENVIKRAPIKKNMNFKKCILSLITQLKTLKNEINTRMALV